MELQDLPKPVKWFVDCPKNLHTKDEVSRPTVQTRNESFAEKMWNFRHIRGKASHNKCLEVHGVDQTRDRKTKMMIWG